MLKVQNDLESRTVWDYMWSGWSPVDISKWIFIYAFGFFNVDKAEKDAGTKIAIILHFSLLFLLGFKWSIIYFQ